MSQLAQARHWREPRDVHFWKFRHKILAPLWWLLYSTSHIWTLSYQFLANSMEPPQEYTPPRLLQNPFVSLPKGPPANERCIFRKRLNAYINKLPPPPQGDKCLEKDEVEWNLFPLEMRENELHERIYISWDLLQMQLIVPCSGTCSDGLCRGCHRKRISVSEKTKSNIICYKERSPLCCDRARVLGFSLVLSVLNELVHDVAPWESNLIERAWERRNSEKSIKDLDPDNRLAPALCLLTELFTDLHMHGKKGDSDPVAELICRSSLLHIMIWLLEKPRPSINVREALALLLIHFTKCDAPVSELISTRIATLCDDTCQMVRWMSRREVIDSPYPRDPPSASVLMAFRVSQWIKDFQPQANRRLFEGLKPLREEMQRLYLEHDPESSKQALTNA